ncbi:MAG: bacillithiol biosynthesis BshC, partial [Candidatus Eisenbacteria bacterium]
MKPLGSLPRPERGEAWDLSRLRAAVESRRRGELDEKTAAELLAWNLRLGAAPAVAESWRAVTRGEGVVVVTGQQPAMLGGPLYTLYKLLTADALAKEIEARMGRPALAVFWLVGDDSDFGEVASTWLPDAEARPVQLRDEESPPRGALIGRLSRERQRAVWDGASALRSAFPRAEDGAKLVADAFAVA